MKFLVQGNKGSLRWGSNTQVTDYESDAPCCAVLPIKFNVLF